MDDVGGEEKGREEVQYHVQRSRKMMNVCIFTNNNQNESKKVGMNTYTDVGLLGIEFGDLEPSLLPLTLRPPVCRYVPLGARLDAFLSLFDESFVGVTSAELDVKCLNVFGGECWVGGIAASDV